MTTGTIFDYLAHGPAENADGNTAAFKPGVKADHEEGIGWIGPWELPFDGFSEHTRRAARALALTGLPVQLRSLDQNNMRADTALMEPIELLLRPLLRASLAKYTAQIYQVVPYDSLLQFLTTHNAYLPGELAIINAHRVLYTVWERDRISEAARIALNRAGQAWVACAANRQMLIDNGVEAERVKVVPCPWFDDDPLLALRGRARRPGPPRFYHVGKWEPRKAQDQMIGAFMLAFHPGEAEMRLRCSPLADNVKVEGFLRSPMEALDYWLKDKRVADMGWTQATARQSIRVAPKRLSPEEMVQLHAWGDVYVSLSRGEGFDMPAQDAKLAGNLMVYTPSGGTQALAAPEDYVVASSGSVPCHPFYKWNHDASYLDYSVHVAATALRQAALAVPGYSRAGSDLDWCRANVVGHMMREYLDELLANGRRVAVAYGEALKAQAEAPSAETPRVEAVPEGPRVLLVTHGMASNAPYGGMRVNAQLFDLLRKHPLIGSVEAIPQNVSAVEHRADVALVEVPTGTPYIERLGVKRVALLRYGDQGHGSCAFELIERGLDMTVVVPTEWAYQTLGYGIPHVVVHNAFEPPDEVRRGGRRGKKVLYTGAFRFAKGTPLAAEVARKAPDVQFVWRKSSDLAEPLASLSIPPNVELCDPTADRDELWRDIGCVLLTSRFESFALIAYEAACRGIPVVYHGSLGSIHEWVSESICNSGDDIAGVLWQGSASGLAAMCRATTDWSAEKIAEVTPSLLRLAEGVHERSLSQLDSFVREFVAKEV